MTPTTNAARKKRRKKRRRGKKLFAFAALMMLIAAVFYVLSVTVLFNIKKVEIAGSSRYSAAQIEELSGVAIGDNLIRMNPDGVSEQLCGALPYIGTAKVERRFPDTVRITVAECKADTVYEYDGGYIIASGEKSLEKVSKKPEGLITIKAKLGNFSIGFPIKLAEGESEALSQLKKAVSDVKLAGVTHIDVQNISDLSIVCDGKLRLRIGTTESLEKKMYNAVKIIETQRKKYGENVEGTVDLRYLSDESNLSYFTRESIWDAESKPEQTESEVTQISSDTQSK